jgi:homoserine dehydrogenase
MTSVALLGYGVVGTGVVELLERNRERLRGNNSEDISIAKILVRDKKKHSNKRYSNLLTDNIEDVFRENIDIVIEVMGGLYPAYEYVKRSLSSRKHVVTANKDLIAEHGKELLDIAKDNGVTLHFEASVGGGIPILKPLKECLVGNEIKEIKAIINGTTNFILSKMYGENMSYTEALALAQKLGFAEAKPESDVLGYDAGRKLSILSTIAYNKRIDWKSMNIEGITDIDELDFVYAKRLNSNIKLVGLSKRYGDKIYAAVKPMLVDANSTLGRIENENNAIIIEGDAVGEVVFSGKGAGMLPTASAVFSDLMDTFQQRKEEFLFNSKIAELESLWDTQSEWMLRFSGENSTQIISSLHESFSTCTTEINKISKDIVEVVSLVKVENERELNKRIGYIQSCGKTSFVKKFRKL